MKIVWSEYAKSSYEDIIDFILKQWNIEVALEFEKITNRALSRIKNRPEICPKLDNELRRCVIHKNVSFFYKVEKDLIVIVAFVDNRSEHGY